MAKLGLRLNLANRAPSQYRGYDFDSIAHIGDMPIAISEDGIFEAFTGDTDDGEQIGWQFELPRSDMNSTRNKRIRSMYLGGRFNGEVDIPVTDDEESQHTYRANPLKTNKQHVVKVNGGRNFNKGCYYTFAFQDVQGSKMILDFFEIVPMILQRNTGGF